LPGRIDLNADIGEGFGVWTLGDDLAMLEIITSANVACGFHAGDAAIMRSVCSAASARGVRIGAQVSYRDLAGFGRREMDVAPDQLTADVLYQIGALSAFGDVAYVKPHGALYHRIFHDEVQAAAVVEALRAWRQPLPILGLPASAALRLAAQAGFPTIAEGFADRAYTSDGRLVPRGEAGAVITDPAEVARQAIQLATAGQVRTLCMHGDTPGAVTLARGVRAALEGAGFALEAFA
jgi:5-oxoprolinase (ATP-hydrolysing) subunit A